MTLTRHPRRALRPGVEADVDAHVRLVPHVVALILPTPIPTLLSARHLAVVIGPSRSLTLPLLHARAEVPLVLFP